MSFPRPTKTSVLVFCALFLAGCAATTSPPPGAPAPDQEADRAELLRLDEELIRSQIVARDSTVLVRVALDDFRVLAPGGLIENKAQAVAGVSSWNAEGVEVSGAEVVFHGPVALVTGRLDIDGEMRPVGRWGPLKFMSTWIHEDGEWRLLGRSLTPCIDLLIEMGRC